PSGRQHRSLSRAARQLFHDGRQPSQFDRQPLPAGRLRAVRKHRRPRPDHFLLGARGGTGVGGVALAVFGALEPAVHDRAMTRAAKSYANANAQKTAPQPNERAGVAASAAKKPSTSRGARKRRVAASALEKTISYRFKDRDLLERSLTHISALAGGSRANSYQRLEFLGDHVLGLIISDMLFRAFPKADEGELSRRLADLVRREACADVARVLQRGEGRRA